MSEISFSLSLINLILTYKVWFGEIRDGKPFFNLRANVLEINLESTLRKEIGLQFSMKRLSLYFLSISLMTSCFLELINPLTTNVPRHIETSELICYANKLTGFYMMGNIGR